MFITNIDKFIRIQKLIDSGMDILPVDSIPLYEQLVNSGFMPIGRIFNMPIFIKTEQLIEAVEKFEKEVDYSESSS